MHSRRSMTGAITAVLALTVSACTHGGQNAGAHGGGRDLTVARPIDVVDLSPDGSFVRSSDSQVVALIADSLYKIDENDRIEPALAAGMPKVSKDQLAWTIELRPGITFSNGSPLTSKDVKFSLENARKGTQQGKLFEPISSIETPSATTVVIHTIAKDATLLWALAGFTAAILPDEFAGMPAQRFYQKPIGAGAYMIAERKPGVDLKLVRNPHYYGAAPKPDSITFTPVADRNARMTQLRAGAVNMVEDPPVEQVSKIKSDSTLRIYSRPIGVMRLGLNTAKPPLNDLHVRRAISLAMDRASMVRAVLGGGGSVACSWINVTFLRGYQPPFGCLVDLNQAKSEMAKSSYPHGASFSLTYDGGDAQMPLTAQIVQSDLAKIGIQVKLNGTTNQLYKAALANRSFQGRFSLFALPGDPGLSVANYVDTDAESTSSQLLPQIKQEFEKSTRTLDEAARFKMYNTIVDQIAGNADAIGMYSPNKIFASTTKIGGVKILPTNKVNFADISVSG